MRISDWSSDVCSSDLASPANANTVIQSQMVSTAHSLRHRRRGDTAFSSMQPLSVRDVAEARGGGSSAFRTPASRSTGQLRLAPRDFRYREGSEIGRESCRTRVRKYGTISGVDDT